MPGILTAYPYSQLATKCRRLAAESEGEIRAKLLELAEEYERRAIELAESDREG